LKTNDSGASWRKINTNLEDNLYALDFYDEKIGLTVGANGTVLRSADGGETWREQETSFKVNLYAVTCYNRKEAIAVGEAGAIFMTRDGGETWERQPSITNKSLQAIVYLGGIDLWIAGRGGSILRRSETMSAVRTTEGQKLPPTLRLGIPKSKPKTRQPIVTVADDGDIPAATEPKKEKDN
jgi:hypothetical protein